MGDHHKIVTCGECGQQAPAWKMDTKKMSNGLVYYVCGKNTPNKRMHLTLRLWAWLKNLIRLGSRK